MRNPELPPLPLHDAPDRDQAHRPDWIKNLLQDYGRACIAHHNRVSAEREAELRRQRNDAMTLRALSKSFYNATLADPEVKVRCENQEKSDAVQKAGEMLREALLMTDAYINTLDISSSKSCDEHSDIEPHRDGPKGA